MTNMSTNFAKLEFEHLEPALALHVRRIVGRCHVGDTNAAVVKYVLSRFKRKKLQRDATPAMRRELWAWVKYCHGRNLTEFLLVMGATNDVSLEEIMKTRAFKAGVGGRA